MSQSKALEKGKFDSHDEHIILPFWKKVSYGVGGATHMLMSNGMGQMTVIYTMIFGVDPLIVGAVLFWPRMWDGITDLIMGHISDNTRTRWGRRRPYIFIGGIITALVFPLMLNIPGFADGHEGLWLLVTSLIFYTAYTVFLVTYNALGMEMSLDYNERSRVMAFRSWFAGAGMLLPFWAIYIMNLPIFPDPVVGAKWFGWMVALLCLITITVVTTQTKEIKEVQSQERIKIWDAFKYTFSNAKFLLLAIGLLIFEIALVVWIPLNSFVIFYYVFPGDMKMGALFGASVATSFAFWKFFTIGPITWVGTKIGKQKTFGLGILITTVSICLGWFFYVPENPWLIFVAQLIGIWGLPAFEIFPYAIMADICDLDEMKTGKRREGMFSSALGFSQKMGIAASALITGVVMSVIGFQEELEFQEPEVLFKLRLAMVIVPAIFMILSAIVVFLLKMPESRVREIRGILDARKKEAKASAE